MAVSAAQVKELRERTGLGMMECKKALVECDGNIDKAIELLRKRAGAKVEKKASRIAAEGRVSTHLVSNHKLAAMVEVNCETDFVAKEDGFVEFVDVLVSKIAEHDPFDIDALMQLELEDGRSAREAADNLVARLGEKISVRRFVRYDTKDGQLDAYVHAGSRIAVLVEMQGGDGTLAHDVAMQVAWQAPEYLTRSEVPSEIVAKEKEILMEQARDSGKPQEIMEKMVAGRLNKYISELTLLGKPFVKDPDVTVEKLLKSASANVLRFCRYEVGEGLEKRSSDFAAEVIAQARGG